MAIDKYATPASIAARATVQPQPGRITDAGDTSGTTSGTSTSKTTSSTSNMDPTSLAALQSLIAQLMSGGTPQMLKDAGARKSEANKVTQLRAGYSKEAAFADAQGLMAQTMRRVLEQLVPSIGRAAEGAGTSQSSLRALLLQDAAAKAAESSSTQGLNAAIQYGGISSNLSNTLEALLRPNNSASDALLQALNTAKGAIVNSTSSTTGTTEGQTAGQANNVRTIEMGPITAPAPMTAPEVDRVRYWGPSEDSSKSDWEANNTHVLLNKLASNFTNNYTF